MVGVLGHLGLLVSHAAQGAGGARVLLAATLGLHCQDSVQKKKDAISHNPFGAMTMKLADHIWMNKITLTDVEHG